MALLASAPAVAAQRRRPPPVQPSARLDALVSHHTSVQLGAGLSIPASRYVRISGIVGAGAGEQNSAWRAEGRVDLIARLMLIPDYSARWAPYLGAGAGVRVSDAPPRELLLLVAGVEGPRQGGVVPFFELGLGGGVRAGLGLRRATPPRR